MYYICANIIIFCMCMHQITVIPLEEFVYVINLVISWLKESGSVELDYIQVP